jgi:hypothetical protein
VDQKGFLAMPSIKDRYIALTKTSGTVSPNVYLCAMGAILKESALKLKKLRQECKELQEIQANVCRVFDGQFLDSIFDVDSEVRFYEIDTSRVNYKRVVELMLAAHPRLRNETMGYIREATSLGYRFAVRTPAKGKKRFTAAPARGQRKNVIFINTRKGFVEQGVCLCQKQMNK